MVVSARTEGKGKRYVTDVLFFFLNLIPVEVGSVVHSKELDEVGDGREENG